MNVDFFIGGQVFWYLNYQVGVYGGWFGVGVGGCVFNIWCGFDNFQVNGLWQFQCQQLVVSGQYLYVWYFIFWNKLQFFFNLFFGKGVRGIVFFIYEYVFVVIDVGEVDEMVGQGDGIDDIVVFEVFFYFQVGVYIGEMYFIQCCSIVGVG